ncbi:MAG: hypothetical protein LC635_06655 [Pseudonocardiaceae bacterium]|nr:hypothetical protein [Pseudonocardiaceae bacterium]
MSATDVTRAEAESDEPPQVPVRPAEREPTWSVRRLGSVLAPALIFLGIRELGLLVLTWMANRNFHSVPEALRSWDGQWFLAIAGGGYAGVPDGLVDAYGQRHAETPLAFFPGYPTGVRWFAALDGSGGIGLVTSALTVTIVSGVVCSYALARLGRHIRGGSPRTGLILVALFAATPMSIVLSMAYSEAMFCAFAAWTLVGVLEKRCPSRGSARGPASGTAGSRCRNGAGAPASTAAPRPCGSAWTHWPTRGRCSRSRPSR